MTEASPPASRADETLVLVNPASGSGRTERRWPAIRDRLLELGVPARVELTTRPASAIDSVRVFLRAGGRDVIVLGGDGTAGEVAAGCIDEAGDDVIAEGITLAFVHQGTGGDLVRGLGIPKETEAALQVAANGQRRPIDIGVARYRSSDGTVAVRGFSSCANVGMASEVVEQVTGKLKRFGNSGAFAIATINCLSRNRPRSVAVTLDGETANLEIVDIALANNRYMGGGMFVAPDAKIDDGQFDVVLISAAGRARLIRTFPKIYKGTHVHDPLVRVARAREVELDAPQRQQGVVLDGELVGRTPASFRLLRQAVQVRVPASPS